MSEAIRVQVELTAKVPKGLELTKALCEEVLEKWIRRGTLPPGFTVKAIHWGTPGGKPKGSATTQEDINFAVRRLLRRIPFTFSEIRFSKRIR